MTIDRTPIRGFKAVVFSRQAKEALSREMEGKTFAERQALLRPYRAPNAQDRATKATAASAGS